MRDEPRPAHCVCRIYTIATTSDFTIGTDRHSGTLAATTPPTPSSHHPHNRQNGERPRRACRPVSDPPKNPTATPTKALFPTPKHQHQPNPSQDMEKKRKRICPLLTRYFPFCAGTSPASAARPTASSRPRTTALSRSPSPRLTRTAVTLARTRSTLFAASSAPWARATTAPRASAGRPRVHAGRIAAQSRCRGGPEADRRTTAGSGEGAAREHEAALQA